MTSSQARRRVVIVDDSRTIQAMLDNAFGSRPEFQVVGFAADASTAVEVIRRLTPDIVTVDLTMPYLDGEALLVMLQGLDRVCKVVVSDRCVSNRLLNTRLVQAGASLCLAKSELIDNPAAFFKKIGVAAARINDGGPARPTTTDAPMFGIGPAAPPVRFPVPADERERLARGKCKNLFNALREPQFDVVTRNAARLTGFPISMLTFIDRDTQWIKSAHGMDMETTPRDQAFCNYTIAQGGPFVVANAVTDERFAANPLVTEAPGIRTYTGHPVVTGDGVTIGALCIVDTRVRLVSRHALDQLAGMAEIVAEFIDLRPAIAA